MLSWGAKTTKYLLFTSNLIFFLIGIIILSVGVSVKAYFAHYEPILDVQYYSIANLLIAVGIIIFLISFFGCCGAIKNSYCMLMTFSSSLILVFILLMSAGIAGYAMKNRTMDFLSRELQNSMAFYNGTNTTYITTFWNNIQDDFNCCGVHNASDWVNVSNSEILPSSCCKTIQGEPPRNCTIEDDLVRQDGCLDAFGTYIMDHAATLGGVGIGFGVLIFLGILGSCYLTRTLRMNYQIM